jgi:D-lactate dehydrogenase
MQEHHIGGLGLDVFEDEPNAAAALRSGNSHNSLEAQTITALLQHPNVLFTPHNAFNTIEAVQRKSQFSVHEVLYFLKNKNFRIVYALESGPVHTRLSYINVSSCMAVVEWLSEAG